MIFLLSFSPSFSYLLGATGPGDFAARLLQICGAPGSKRIFTLVFIIVCAVVAIRSVQQARADERRRPLRPSAAPQNLPGPSGPPATPALTKLPFPQRYLENPQNKPVVTISLKIFKSLESLKPATVEILLRLAKSAHLLVIQQGASTEQQEIVKNSLETLGLFDNGLARHRVLFCDTSSGKISINRHLEPSLVIDESLEVLKALKPFVADCVLVHEIAPHMENPPLSAAAPGPGIEIIKTQSLEALFLGQGKENPQDNNHQE